ncbi:hypothetical protein N0V93_002461 [Gnomoniopsis smithogilvyi]|uniref:Uncharacterized protein n=1 Tax=Gnomoniopsis smithogilvyi TaxID=1191159 RepID=A0A9W9CZ34_9PEZI|nr:hypothetical protein N0V93_002461 [Gnomoniopsis smithogilvyi]
MSPATVLVLGTCDTKLQELLFLKDHIGEATSVRTILLDVGRDNVEHEGIDISQARLIADYGQGQTTSDLPRGEVIKLMASCATRAVKNRFEKGEISGIISAGGTGGTSLVAQVMREALPIGFPKMIVSTVASGDTGPLVGETDITMMYSVVDVAGLNQVLRDVLGNAAAAIAGMAQAYASRPRTGDKEAKKAKRVGITMFGVTTPGADAIRNRLEGKYGAEAFVFHATGHGGKAMERLVREGKLDAVLDLTTTEICDLITGGVMSAAPDRLEAALQAGIPCIISVGATDMSNFGPKNTVPEVYRSRNLYEHNPVVTLMRSSKDESKQVGDFIVKKVNKAKNPKAVQVWLPLRGVSMIATPGGPFADADADEALFETIRAGLEGTEVRVVEDKRDINDKGFAEGIADALAGLMGL